MGLGLAILVCFALLVWAGRRPASTRRAVRLGAGLLSGLAAVGAVVSGLRGAWLISLLFMALSAYMGSRTRGPAESNPLPGTPHRREALAILGLVEGATPDEIRAAHRRLIREAHPDRGGSAVYAAKLNAARDRLLRPGD